MTDCCTPFSWDGFDLAVIGAGSAGFSAAITAAEIALAVKKAGGPALDKRSVQIAKPIKLVGKHTVGVKLHDAVNAHITVDVAASE